MSVLLTDETGLSYDEYFFRYNIDGAGFIESSFTPDLAPLTQEITKVQAVSDVSGSLEGTYFLLSSLTTDYYVWMNAHRDTILAVAEETQFGGQFNYANEANIGGRYWTLNSPTTGYYVWYNRHVVADSGTAEVTKIVTVGQGTQNGASASLTNALSKVRGCVLDSTTSIVAYRNNSNYPSCKIGTRTGSSISFGSEYALVTSALAYTESITTLDSTHFLLMFVQQNGANWDLYGVIGVASGGTISYGTAVLLLASLNTSVAPIADSDTLDSTHAIVVYTGTQSTTAFGVIAAISGGTTITWGTPVQFTVDGTGPGGWNVTTLDSTHTVVSWAATPIGVGICRLHNRIATVSGSSISWGSVYSATTSELWSPTLQTLIQNIDSSHFLTLGKKSSTWIGYVGTISAGIITYSGEKSIPFGINSRFNEICKLDSTHFALIYHTGPGGTGNGNVRVDRIYVYNNISWDWGISESDVTASGSYPTISAFDSTYTMVTHMSSTTTSFALISEPFKQARSSGIGKYFTLNSNTTPYFVWFDLNNSKTAPVPLKHWAAIACNSDGTKIVGVDRGSSGDTGFLSAPTGMVHTTPDSGSTNYIRSLAGSRQWTAVACSNDGAKIIAGGRDTPLWYSTDSGATWSYSNHDFESIYEVTEIDCSSDGTKVIIAAGSKLYRSTDSGATITKLNFEHGIIGALASSADGTKLAVCAGSYIYTSINSGADWTERTTAPSSCRSIASSSDGTKLVAAVYNGYIWTSTDSGANWTERTTSSSSSWVAVCSSDDGVKLAAAPDSFNIYTSADSGANWAQRTNSQSGGWTDIDCSTNGSVIIASMWLSVTSGHIRISTDSGANWSTLSMTTPIEIDVTTGDSATTIASTMAIALDGKSDLVSTSSNDVVTVTCASVGNVQDPEDIDNSYSCGLPLIVSTQGTDILSNYDDTNPAPGGRTGIEVRFNSGDTAETVDQKTSDSINTNQGSVFTASKPLSNWKVVNDVAAAASDATVGTMNDWLSIFSGPYVLVQGVTYEAEYNSTDPAPVGKTEIEVRYTENDTADNINTKLSNKIDTETDFNAEFSFGTSENWGIDCTSTSIAGKYWIFDAPNGTGGINKYYVWYYIGGGGTDPGPIVGRTGIQVTVPGGKPSVANVATYTASTLNSVVGTYVTATSTGHFNYYLEMYRWNAGACDDDVNISTKGLYLITSQQGNLTTSEISQAYFYSTDVNSTYWVFDAPAFPSGINKYYVWYNVNGTGIDPAPPGRIEIKVALPSSPTEANIYSYTETAINTIAAADIMAYSTYISFVAKVYVTCDYPGNVDDPQNIDFGGNIRPCVDGIAPTGGALITNVDGGPAPDAVDFDTGFTITTEEQGQDPTPATTWDDILIKLNGATVGGTWSLYQGDIRLTSDTTGLNAKVRLAAGLSGLNLFENLTGFVTFDPAKDPYPS
jgi:hypothetical protein